MEVKIGIQMAPRELVVETDETADRIAQHLDEALADGDVFRLSDTRGNIILVPAEKVAYVELSSAEPRRIGFGA